MASKSKTTNYQSVKILPAETECSEPLSKGHFYQPHGQIRFPPSNEHRTSAQHGRWVSVSFNLRSFNPDLQGPEERACHLSTTDVVQLRGSVQPQWVCRETHGSQGRHHARSGFNWSQANSIPSASSTLTSFRMMVRPAAMAYPIARSTVYFVDGIDAPPATLFLFQSARHSTCNCSSLVATLDILHHCSGRAVDEIGNDAIRHRLTSLLCRQVSRSASEDTYQGRRYLHHGLKGLPK